MNTNKHLFSQRIKFRYVSVLIPLIIGITFLRGFNLIANAKLSIAPNSPTLGLLVEQNFNGTTADVLNSGWFAENNSTKGIIINAIDPLDETQCLSGKDPSAYHTCPKNGDRAFGFYKTRDKKEAQNSFIRFTFTTVEPINEISGSFDFESSYSF